VHKNWGMSPESFEALLNWLDPDREQAAFKYEQIRSGLINLFSRRSLCDAEDLADETINRVINRLDEIRNQVSGDRGRYFFGVAHKVLLEHQRRKQPQNPPLSDVDSNLVELEFRCLEECMSKLSDENRELVLQYYQAEGREKIEHRKQLAERLGIAPNALRIRAYRIRAALQKCLDECMERSSE
jgi:RNA polymerase sigma factor (sigma-70 family)